MGGGGAAGGGVGGNNISQKFPAWSANNCKIVQLFCKDIFVPFDGVAFSRLN